MCVFQAINLTGTSDSEVSYKKFFPNKAFSCARMRMRIYYIEEIKCLAAEVKCLAVSVLQMFCLIMIYVQQCYREVSLWTSHVSLHLKDALINTLDL